MIRSEPSVNGSAAGKSAWPTYGMGRQKAVAASGVASASVSEVATALDWRSRSKMVLLNARFTARYDATATHTIGSFGTKLVMPSLAARERPNGSTASKHAHCARLPKEFTQNMSSSSDAL